MTDFYSAGRRPASPSTASRMAGRRLTGPARRRWPRRLLIGVNVAVAACLIGAVSAYGYVQWRLDQIHRKQIAGLTSINGGKAFTVLIVGSDSRSALAKNADNQQFGATSSVGGQRSDTIILARIAPAARQIMLLSIPRDLWVNIPGMGMNRINSAFDSGPSLLVQTIEADLGIPINHYIEVNFDTFRDITNAVGGVSFYFPTPAKDAYSLLNVTHPGCIALSGDQALGFVRARHYEYYQNGYWHFEAESDLARIRRQQAFIRKMVKKAESKFTDPTAVNGVIGGITKNLTVDSKFSNNMLLNLAQDFHGIDPSSIATVTLPNYGYTTGGGAEVLGLQQPAAAATIAAFNNFGNNLPPASSHTSSHKKTAKTVPPITAPPVTVAPSSVSVEAANGDGVAGQAAQMNSFLAGLGYRTFTNVVSPVTGLATTQVRYAPDSKTAAEQIAAAIPGGATLLVDPNLSPTPYNVEVVTGTTYSAASGATASSGSSSAGSTSSTASTTTTTVPGTNATEYTLPGLPAGQTPPPC